MPRQRASSRPVFLLFLLMTGAAVSLPADSPRGWRLDCSLALQFRSDSSLQQFTTAENRYLDLYFRQNPAYRTIRDPGLSSHALGWIAGACIRFCPDGRLRVGAGLDILYAVSANSGAFTFQRSEDWRTLTDTLDYRDMDTRITLVYPHLEIGRVFPLNARLNLELSVTGGPVCARAVLSRRILDSIDVREVGTGNRYRLYEDERSLEMTGRGWGWGAGAGLKMEWMMSRRLGLFLEAAYSFFHLPGLEGPSSALAGGVERRWEGEWFRLEEHVEKAWGAADFTYPSNDPRLQSRSAGSFSVDLHGFPTLRLGMFIHF